MNPGIAAARFLSADPMRTAVMGAGVGAVAGGLRRPAEGQSRLRNAAIGGLGGAAVGAVGGGLGRAYRDTRLLTPGLSGAAAIPATARRLGGEVKNFGKRQIHGLTGKYDPDAIGMAGNVQAGRKTDLIRKRMDDELAHAPAARHARIKELHEAEIASELQAGRSSQELMDAGVTNLRGMGKALMTPGKRGPAFRAMGRAMINGPGGAAMSLGVPALALGPSLMRGDESATGGPTTGKKLRDAALMVGSGAAFGGLPLIPQMLAGSATEAGLRSLGHLRNRNAPRPVRGSMLGPGDPT